MEKIAQSFGLKRNSKFVDSEGKEVNYHGCSEVKGIKAGDGRMYLMDLM